MIQDEIERMQKEMSSALQQQQQPVDMMDDDLELYANETTTTATAVSPLDIISQEKKSRQSWPEYLSGMKLGLITRRIREGDLEVKHIPERKEKLDAISFDW